MQRLTRSLTMWPTVHPSPAPVRSVEAPLSTVYQDDAVAPLPVVNITRTLAAKLCGRLDDEAFNNKIINLTKSTEALAHGVVSVAAGTGFLLYLVRDILARKLLTAIVTITGLLYAIYTCASLSWDVLRLATTTFQFWFLFAVTTMNTIQWCFLFHDSRVAAFIIIGVMYALPLTIDANIYSRHLTSRILFVATPSLPFVLALTVANIPPDLDYQNYRVLGVHIDALDLLVNGTLVIVYFTFIVVVRSRHLILTFAPVRHIKCDFYVPLSHLVPQTQGGIFAEEASLRDMTMRNHSGRKTTRQLKLLRDKETHGMDVSEFLLPRIVCCFDSSRAHTILNAVGFLSLGLAFSAFVWAVAWTMMATAPQFDDPFPLPMLVLALIGLVGSSTLVLIHIAHFQPKLVKRVFLEVDAWFVSFHVTAVSIGSCDLLGWMPTYVALITTAWVLCHWTVFLDALPHVTRRRIRFSRPLLLLISMLLAAYPLFVVFTLYISREILTNRVIFKLNIGDMSIRSDMLSFVASKLFMLFVWMLRGLWRELMWPVEAFKLLERKVFYRVYG